MYVYIYIAAIGDVMVMVWVYWYGNVMAMFGYGDVMAMP